MVPCLFTDLEYYYLHFALSGFCSSGKKHPSTKSAVPSFLNYTNPPSPLDHVSEVESKLFIFHKTSALCPVFFVMLVP